MNLNRKYAALPDLDSAPDIYETPSLTDDNSTAPDGTARSGSASSHYTDFDSPPGTPSHSPQISRARLHTDAARSRFEPSLVDAKDVDFSDRISGKKKSYRASSRRVRVLADGTREMGDLSDEEDGEGLERKMARLRREVEEVRVEAEQRRRGREGRGEEGEEEVEDEAVGLSRLLEELVRPVVGAEGKAARLSKALSKPLPPAEAAPTSGPASKQTTDAAGPATYTVTYAPSYDPTHTLARITTFDTRLASLESALGLPPAGSNAIHPVLPALTTLSQKLAVIGSATPSSIDALSRRVRALTAETEKMAAVKEAARAATPGGAADGEKDEDDEQAAKINALFGTLATIEGLAPLLPGVLERMRSLRKVHADAAGAQGEMEEALRRQEEMGAEIEKWRVGLERVEEAVREGERVGGENVKTVEGWVRELEERVKNLDG
ncbi:hypothetical protein VE02_01500 [Pseudogymnoascus sp. 03VT05]|nr:hypothetical protein VE02_01500 [Pseudogymnoascus sp. 03VT05]